MDQGKSPSSFRKGLIETLGKVKLLGLGNKDSNHDKVTEELQSGPSAAQNKYECPMCSNYLLPPIYQCYNGHTLCHQCESNVKKCPQKSCRGEFPKNKKKIRSLVLEEIVVGLKFDCQNQRFGCPVENLRFDQFKDHTSKCSFAEISYCSQLGFNCKEKCTRTAIAAHLKSAHPQITRLNLQSVEDNIPLFPSIQGVPNFKYNVLPSVPAYMEWAGQIFFIKLTFNCQENCSSWMICTADCGSGPVGTGKSDCAEFVGSMRLTSIHSQENSMEWTGEIGTLSTPFGYNEFSFNIPLQTLKTFAEASTDGRRHESSSSSVEWRVDTCLLRRNRYPVAPTYITSPNSYEVHTI